MGLLARLFGAAPEKRATGIQPLSFDEFVSWFSFQGHQYPFWPSMTSNGKPQEEPEATFEGYVHGAYRTNGVVFACMLARLMLFSEARFQFRQLRSGRPGDLFGTEALGPLERPWQNATTGDLLSRAIQDVDLAGNFYAVRRGDTIRRMRPDWVTIVLGSDVSPKEPGFALDAEVVGYLYTPGGPKSGNESQVLLAEQVAHFAPIPDPAARFRGMSWLTPVLRDIMADKAATDHKLTYLEKGATPNLAVTLDPSVTYDVYRQFEEAFESKYADLRDAYRTIILGGGADMKVVGSNFEQLQFKDTQGAGETRIAAAAGVPPVIVGLSEGLEAATYSNYGQARRRFADGTMRPLWRSFAGSIATLIQVPERSELWYDDRDIPFLQEDVKDAADILEVHSRAIRNLTDGGYEPGSVVEAVTSGDLRRLKHTGLLSVQMQKPGANGSKNGKPDPEQLEAPV